MTQKWHEIGTPMSMTCAMKGLIALEKEKAKHSAPVVRMNDIQAEIERHKTLLTTLYTDLKDGILSQDEYAYANI